MSSRHNLSRAEFHNYDRERFDEDHSISSENYLSSLLTGRGSTASIAINKAARVRRLVVVIVSFLQLLLGILLLVIIFSVFDRFEAITTVPFLAVGFVQIAHGMAMWLDHHRPTAISALTINLMMIVLSIFAFGLQVNELAKCWDVEGSCYKETFVTLSSGAVTVVCEGICPSDTANVFQLIFVLLFAALSVVQVIMSAYIIKNYEKIQKAIEFEEELASEDASQDRINRAAAAVLRDDLQYGISDDIAPLVAQVSRGDRDVREDLRKQRATRNDPNRISKDFRYLPKAFGDDVSSDPIGKPTSHSFSEPVARDVTLYGENHHSQNHKIHHRNATGTSKRSHRTSHHHHHDSSSKTQQYGSQISAPKTESTGNSKPAIIEAVKGLFT